MAALKYCMIIANVLVWIAGVIALAVGLWAVLDKNFSSRLCPSNSTATNTGHQKELCDATQYIKPGGILLIFAGGSIVIIGFLGCCGAKTESKCMLGIYFVLMLIFLIILLAAGIYGFAKKGSIMEDVQKNLKAVFAAELADYNKNGDEIKNLPLLGELQAWLKCCGSTGPSDYTKPKPGSCFADGKQTGTLNSGGCVTAVTEWFQHNFNVVGIIGIVMAILLALGVICSIVLCRSIEHDAV